LGFTLIAAQTISFATFFLGWTACTAFASWLYWLSDLISRYRFGRHIFIKKLRFGRWTASLARGKYLVNQNAPIKRDRQNIADFNLIGCLLNLIAIDADFAADGEFRRQRS
jgi:hypothetical protein